MQMLISFKHNEIYNPSYKRNFEQNIYDLNKELIKSCDGYLLKIIYITHKVQILYSGIRDKGRFIEIMNNLLPKYNIKNNFYKFSSIEVVPNNEPLVFRADIELKYAALTEEIVSKINQAKELDIKIKHVEVITYQIENKVLINLLFLDQYADIFKFISKLPLVDNLELKFSIETERLNLMYRGEINWKNYQYFGVLHNEAGITEASFNSAEIDDVIEEFVKFFNR